MFNRLDEVMGGALSRTGCHHGHCSRHGSLGQIHGCLGKSTDLLL